MEQQDKVAAEEAASRATSRRSLLLIGGIAVAGAVVAGTIAGLRRDVGGGLIALLDEVPAEGLAQIRPSLAPAAAAGLIEDAQRCQEPLARVAILHSAGSTGGVVSIRSGGYRSPAFTLTATPTLVGIPFPAPYQAGRGVLVIEGQANGLVIALTPQKLIDFTGSALIPVHWTPASSCR
jgi:hypothetical protein